MRPTTKKRVYATYVEELPSGKTFGRLFLDLDGDRTKLAARLSKHMYRALARGSRAFVGAGPSKVELFIDREDEDTQLADGSRPKYLRRRLVAVPEAGGRRAERLMGRSKNPNFLPPRGAAQ